MLYNKHIAELNLIALIPPCVISKGLAWCFTACKLTFLVLPCSVPFFRRSVWNWRKPWSIHPPPLAPLDGASLMARCIPWLQSSRKLEFPSVNHDVVMGFAVRMNDYLQKYTCLVIMTCDHRMMLRLSLISWTTKLLGNFLIFAQLF